MIQLKLKEWVIRGIKIWGAFPMDALKGTEMRTGGNYCKHEKKNTQKYKNQKKNKAI